ncbi:MAG: PD40 domain-containing protein [Chloroflexi bacterium]|nr:PD40 domain-containing protein [Chloroflexota bacterium]
MPRTMVARVATLVVAGLAGASSLTATAAQGTDPTPRPPGAWFSAIEPGMCFDDAFDADGAWDYATPPLVVDCAEPHDNEVAAIVPMGTDRFPSGDLQPIATELCAPEYEAFLGRPSAAATIRTARFWPDADDWTAGAQDVVCAVYGDRKLVGTARSAALRAPGERLASLREVDGRRHVWLIDTATGEPERSVTDTDLLILLDLPAWRPDGGAIAYAAERTAGDADIFEVSLETGEERRLVGLPGQQDSPAYAPDGRSLAFISRTASTEYDIHVLDLASGDMTQLTTFPGRDANPEWSPDGEHILFRRQADVSDLWLMRADGSDAVQLTSGAGNHYDPRWSPDGTRILYTTDRGGDYDIWVMNADGSDHRQLTTHPANDEFPAWASDGRTIAFQSDRHGAPMLWLMAADGSDASLLTTSSPTGWPRFAPADGD